jgi:hypothetical protein
MGPTTCEGTRNLGSVGGNVFTVAATNVSELAPPSARRASSLRELVSTATFSPSSKPGFDETSVSPRYANERSKWRSFTRTPSSTPLFGWATFDTTTNWLRLGLNAKSTL